MRAIPFSVVLVSTPWNEKKFARAKMVKADRRKLAKPTEQFKAVLRFILGQEGEVVYFHSHSLVIQKRGMEVAGHFGSGAHC